jgi:pilus assembly protein Flp/PilA
MSSFCKVLILNPRNFCPRMARRMLENKYPAEAGNFKSRRETTMNNLFLALYVKLQNLMTREEGQDLVEYALLVCLIALAAITGVNKVASAVTTVFSNISASLA